MEERLAKALLRYLAISQYLADAPPRGRRGRMLAELAGKTWTDSEGRTLQVSAETLRVWVRHYKKDGLDGLMDKPRPAPGVRAIPKHVIDKACLFKREVPERSIDRLLKILVALGVAEKEDIARSTLHRALQEHGLSSRPPSENSTDDLDRFEAATPNALWQSDLLVGPWLPDPEKPGKVRRALLYAFLDDHSRRVLDGRFSFKGDSPALELCMRRALQKYGVPTSVYYDNGQVYRSHHMLRICALLEIKPPVHTTPKRPEGHGKIEALNRRIRSAFIAELKATSIQTLDELNEAFQAWLTYDYENEEHSETKQTPADRWKAGLDRIRWADEEKLRQAFLWAEKRTTDKTGVFSLFGVRYQVRDSKLARRRVEVRYDPEALHEVEIWHNDRLQQRARPLEVHPWRRPKPPAPPPESTDAPAPKSDWLGHLVERRRAEGYSSEPDPRAWKTEADARREQNTTALVDLLADRLDPHVVDEAEIRAWAARFGPVDLERAEETIDALLERHPADLHVRIYLDELLREEDR